jgi:CBS domain-containing protein
MVIAFGLMAVGVVAIILGSFIGGVWFVVIGWFLRNASEQSYQQLVFRTSLEGTTVGQIVSHRYDAAPPDIILDQLVSDYVLTRSQRCVPIVVAGDLLGLVTMSDLQRVPREAWAETSAYRAMTPREQLHIVTPETDLGQALAIMAANDVHQLPVISHREFLGFVTRADVLGLIQIRSELGDRSIPARSEPPASVV